MGAKTRRFGIVLPPMLSGRFRRAASSVIVEDGESIIGLRFKVQGARSIRRSDVRGFGCL
jgi:hypothetical protein